MLPFSDVNLLAVLGATLVAFIIGGLWYGPLFGKSWMKLTGMTGKPSKDEGRKAMILGFINMFVISYALALLLLLVAPSNLQDALVLAALASIGFAATNQIGDYIWTKGPLGLFWINAGWSLVMAFTVVTVLMKWPW